MVDAFYGRSVQVCNGPAQSFAENSVSRSNVAAMAPAPLVVGDRPLAAGDRRDADYGRVMLSAFEHDNILPLSVLAAAVPDCPQPISQFLALVDAGLLGFDPAEAFGADLTVWHRHAA